MKRRLLLPLLLLAACSTSYVAHVHSDGKSAVHFDGRYLTVEGTGTVSAGITDKADQPVYPVAGPLKLEGDFARGYDVRAKKEIPFADAQAKLGQTGHP